MPCFYVPNLSEDTIELIISGDEYHHICNVFRKKIGDEILLTSGTGLLADATIIEQNKKNLKMQINNIVKRTRSHPTISVAVPLLKNKHDNLIIEKLSELGVKDFYPITTERTVRKPSKNTTEKFEKVAIAAIKQCDNAFVPKIHSVYSLPELLTKLKEKKITPIAAFELGEHKLIADVTDANSSVCLIIGPEGGFEASEMQMMLAEEVKPVSLGNHIVRAETAAIMAVSQLLGIYLKANSEYY